MRSQIDLDILNRSRTNCYLQNLSSLYYTYVPYHSNAIPVGWKKVKRTVNDSEWNDEC